MRTRPHTAEELYAALGLVEGIRGAFDYIHDPVIITNDDGEMLYANQAVQTITGFTRDQLFEKTPGEIWGGNMSPEFYEEMWHTIKIAKKPFVGVVHNIAADGRKYYMELRVYPILSATGSVLFFVGIGHEVTEKIANEQKQAELASFFAHFVRSGAAGIKSLVTSLMRSSHDERERAQYVADLEEASTQLVGFAQGLSSIIVPTSGSHGSEIQTISLASVITDVVRGLDVGVRSRGIRVFSNLNPDVVVRAPGHLARQIFENIIANAVQYSKYHGDIHLAFEEKDSEALFICRDNGIGIPAEEQSRVWQPFFRASNVRDIRGRTGMGLYIARNIAEYLRYRVWFESREGEGTTFYVAIPLTHRHEHSV